MAERRGRNARRSGVAQLARLRLSRPVVGGGELHWHVGVQAITGLLEIDQGTIGGEPRPNMGIRCRSASLWSESACVFVRCIRPWWLELILADRVIVSDRLIRDGSGR